MDVLECDEGLAMESSTEGAENEEDLGCGGEREVVVEGRRSNSEAGISLFDISSVPIFANNQNTYNLPRPLEPSAIAKLNPSFLICIATC